MQLGWPTLSYAGWKLKVNGMKILSNLWWLIQTNNTPPPPTRGKCWLLPKAILELKRGQALYQVLFSRDLWHSPVTEYFKYQSPGETWVTPCLYICLQLWWHQHTDDYIDIKCVCHGKIKSVPDAFPLKSVEDIGNELINLSLWFSSPPPIS